MFLYVLFLSRTVHAHLTESYQKIACALFVSKPVNPILFLKRCYYAKNDKTSITHVKRAKAK